MIKSLETKKQGESPAFFMPINIKNLEVVDIDDFYLHHTF